MDFAGKKSYGFFNTSYEKVGGISGHTEYHLIDKL